MENFNIPPEMFFRVLLNGTPKKETKLDIEEQLEQGVKYLATITNQTPHLNIMEFMEFSKDLVQLLETAKKICKNHNWEIEK